jgi:hypothetical protein
VASGLKYIRPIGMVFKKKAGYVCLEEDEMAIPQQLGDEVNTLDEHEQCITIQAATAEELEEDDESSSLLFGKYDKYFHNGDGNYERLYRTAKLILPNALYVTWRGFIDFQVEPGSPCITNKKVAEYTNKNVRTIELNIQRLRQAGFVRTHHVLRGENWVVEKNFSGMYQAVIEYMHWENSSTYMPPTREYFGVDGVDKDVCSKVLHFNNYRRILHNKKPGPKRKKVYPEEQTFIDGVFRELTTVQDSLSGMRAAKPADSQLETASVLPEKMSVQSPAATVPEEKLSVYEEAPVALSEKSLQTEATDIQPEEPGTPILVGDVQPEISNTEALAIGTQAGIVGAHQTIEDRVLPEERSIQSEAVPVQPEKKIEIQAEMGSQKQDAIQGQEAVQGQDIKQEQDLEEMKTRIIKEYQGIVEKEGQEAAMCWMSTQNVEWMQPQDWDVIFEQSNESVQLEDEMKRKEDVVQQELAFESEGGQAVQEDSKGEEQAMQEESNLAENSQEMIDGINEFDKFMDNMVLTRRVDINEMNEWYKFLHQLYNTYGRWLLDTNLIKFPARNQPKVPFMRFLKADLEYRCALRPAGDVYSEEEFIEDLNELCDWREKIYHYTGLWDDNNIWLSNYHGFNKVNQAYLDRVSSEDLKRLKIMVFEPEPDVPPITLKEKLLAERRRLRDEKDKMGENGTV